MRGRLRVARGSLCVAVVVAGLSTACIDDSPAPIPDNIKAEVRRYSQCSREHEFPTPYPLESPTPVPYPTPAGGRVAPTFDVPVFPGAAEIDGFVAREGAGHRVQAFETSASQEELFAFFEEAFLDQGMVVKGAGYGVGGVWCTFVPYYGRNRPDQKYWVTVTTEFTERDPHESAEPPPGFRGKGQPFAPPPGGTLWFFVITPD